MSTGTAGDTTMGADDAPGDSATDDATTGTGDTDDTDDTGDTDDGPDDEPGEESSDSTTGEPIVDDCDNGLQTVEPLIWLRFEGDADNIGSSSTSVDTSASDVDYVEGKCATAVAFGSSQDSYVDIIDSISVLTMSADYTIGVWVYEEDVINQGTLLDFRAGPSGVDGGGFQSYHGASDALTTCASTTPAGGTCRSVAADLVLLGVWHHVLYRCDGDGTMAPDGCSLEVWVDGVFTGGPSTLPLGGNVTFSAAQAEDFRLGWNTNFVLDDFKVYDQVFDEEGQCVEVIGGTWGGGACSLP